jgi:hypothetical protein
MEPLWLVNSEHGETKQLLFAKADVGSYYRSKSTAVVLPPQMSTTMRSPVASGNGPKQRRRPIGLDGNDLDAAGVPRCDATNETVRSARERQMSIFSAIAMASSISMPRYLTVLSTLLMAERKLQQGRSAVTYHLVVSLMVDEGVA